MKTVRSASFARAARGTAAAIALLLAASAAGRAQNALGWPDPGGPIWRFQFLYQRFVAAEMSRSYSWVYGLQGSGIVWGSSVTRANLRVDGALFTARSGHARIIDQNWAAERSKLRMAALDASLTAVFVLREPNPERAFFPYAGIGVGGVFGFDQLRYLISRGGQEHEGHTPVAFRMAFEAHGVAGVLVPVLESFSLVAEVQWIQAGKALFEELGGRSAQDAAEDDLVHSVLLYPDMNITGLRILAGAQIGW